MEGNVFFDFVETYWDEIAEFFKALRDWIDAIIGKFNGGSADDDTSAVA